MKISQPAVTLIRKNQENWKQLPPAIRQQVTKVLTQTEYAKNNNNVFLGETLEHSLLANLKNVLQLPRLMNLAKKLDLLQKK
ncbi:MAG TPA: hypothetical protein P5556_08090 [Candidatus Gastranaerophilales bacterium]|nr:hypothetical protein [Candidatus Gastranaerophilales bacterium]